MPTTKKKNEYQISFVPTPQKITQLMVDLITKPKSVSILEPGCGKGIFIQTLLNNKYENVEGIELNSNFAASCKKKFNNLEIVNDDFLTWETEKRYEVIIGNPPYAHFNSLPSEIQEEVFALTKTKETDIYHAFIIKAIDLLKENGELIFIVPYGFFYNTHAKCVRRKIIDNGVLETVIDLDEVNLFSGELPETVIFRFVKKEENRNNKTTMLRIRTKNAKLEEIYEKATNAMILKKENKLFLYHKRKLSQNEREVWSTYPEITIPEYTKLNEVAYVGVGMVSGFDKAFRIDEQIFETFDSKEKAVVFPFIKATHCKGFYTEGHAKYILLDDEVSTEYELEEYTTIYNRFLHHKEKMSTRYLPQNKQWFHWQALRNKENFEKMGHYPKIFVPTLDRSKRNRFSLTEDRVYPAGDVLCIIPLKIDRFFLLGYLNSAFFRKYYLSTGARRGHRISFTQRILANTKIPVFDEETTGKIIKLTKEILKRKNGKLLIDLDSIVENAVRSIQKDE